MADKDAAASAEKVASSAEKVAASAAKAAPEGNPVFRMMGLPNFRWKLPSRNWMIFWAITGSWTAAVVYDRQQKKRIQKKWCKLVSHLPDEALPLDTLPRRVTVYAEAPPADGLMSARDHFHEYIKPVLVAGALDWDAVEGRRQGDIRAGVAERIRKFRREHGEPAFTRPEETEVQFAVEEMQKRQGIKPYHGVSGDIVIGRHTWKEYIRGIHEGWLGPLDPPAEPVAAPVPAPISIETNMSPTEQRSDSAFNEEDAPVTEATTTTSSTEEAKEEKKEKKEETEEEKKPKKRKQPPPFNTTQSYSESQLPLSVPPELPPSAPIHMPHLLGFLNTPVRMWRFLNRRQVADDTGRQTAAAVLGLYRPYLAPSQTQSNSGFSTTLDASPSSNNTERGSWEQESQLQHEEANWHKSVRNPKDDEEDANKEKIWLPDMVLDERIATRMNKFELSQELERRAKEIEQSLPPWWYFGFGDKEDPKKE